MRVPPARPVFSAEDRRRILDLVDGALSSGSLTLGAVGASFEQAFAARHGGGHAIATSSGTSALEILFRCIGVEESEVVVPANTFFATAAAVAHAGGYPRFADIDAGTLSMSASTLEAALTPATSVAVLVHIGGMISPEAPAIRRICEERGVTLVEDAAHAHGSSLGGRPAGTFGVAAAFSFYPTKVVTSGEGGMILTTDASIRDCARIFRDQGKASFEGGAHVRLGSAWRMSELHAAVGLVQLGRLDEFIEARRRVAATYDAALRDVEGVAPLGEPPGSRSNYYKYPVVLDEGIDRAALRSKLRDSFGVGLSGEVYATPLHHEPVFASVDHPPLPVAEDLCARHICLPVHSDMSEDEAWYVAGSLKSVLAGAELSG